MSDTKENIRIADKLVKYLQDNCDKGERAVVEKWLSNPGNRAIFEDIKKRDTGDVYDRFSMDISDIRSEFYSKIESKKREAVPGLLSKRSTAVFPSRRWATRILSYAAAILIFASLPVLFFIVDSRKNKYSHLSESTEKIEIKYQSPVLTTSGGQEIVIDKKLKHKTIEEKNGVKVNINANSLAYDVKSGNEISGNGMGSGNAGQIAYNTIRVPDCGNFNFTMSDGTIVFLNAGTTLKYPVPFHKDKREIFLDGEAYFEVTKNAKKPFVVHFNQGSVRVLGTVFNVKTYSGKPVTATLVSGSVQVNDKNDNSVILKPSHQAVLDKKSIQVRKVDPYLDIIWKDGYFVYQKMPLDEILQELSRWYDFEYFYQNNEVRDIMFSARIKKFDDIKEVFRILENTGDIKFRIKNKTVIVTR